MLRQIWQWLVKQFRRFLGFFQKSPLVEAPPPPEVEPLSDLEYENFFMQLLEGVNGGWQEAEVRRFFQVLSPRATPQQWLDWLGRFAQRLESATNANHELGRRLLRLGELGQGEIYQAAKQLGDRLLEMDPVAGTGRPKPNDVEGWFAYGKEKMSQEQNSEALAAFDQVIKLDPQHYRAWINRGNVLTNLGQLEMAIAAYEQAIKIKPDAQLAWSNLGDAFYDLERYQDAVNSWDKALEIDPNDSETWYNKGLALAINLGQLEESLVCWEKSLALNPEDAQAWCNYGITLAGLNRWQEAINCWDRATEINPNLREAWINKGKALEKLGRYTEAIEANNRAIAISSNNFQNFSP